MRDGIAWLVLTNKYMRKLDFPPTTTPPWSLHILTDLQNKGNHHGMSETH